MKRLSGEERRAQIVESAYTVILEKGLAGTATRDVTRKLGVGSGLLHHYFRSWADLRAEVVKTFITKEIEALKHALSDSASDNMLERFIDWMIADPEFRFWRLWLDAIEEARRDPELASIVQEGHVQWHETITKLIRQSVDAGLGTCDTPENAAWRVSALIDGLMGMLALDGTPLTKELVKKLLHEQVAMELCRDTR
ncbi:TetR/AcrR family transcriptional regulator [Roseobacter litoralis]|uniref:TetR/AcrR family transcriptional regulator n=1 Tax=Roseobacter litoralis TaxID=42443 RepID=UPI0024936161|nr:TetR family transcriptional regulator C-terminal domain-containing protein [Roseobacter litoralis]